jgi:hypothetical protein
MNRYYWLIGIAILALGVWLEYERRTDPDARDDEYMWCQTATTCATYIEKSYRAELDAGGADFSAVRSQGVVVTVEYDLESVRADFVRGLVEDGRTLELWADEELVAGALREACDKLDHRDFVRMGGTMIHSYQFSDGEILREVVVDDCP